MTHIRYVTVTIDTDDGESHALRCIKPDPRGDNPRFMVQQFDTAMAELLERGRATIRTLHGEQLEKADLQSTEVVRYAQHENSGMVHREDCSSVRSAWSKFRDWDPNRTIDRASATTWHKVCLPGGMPKAR